MKKSLKNIFIPKDLPPTDPKVRSAVGRLAGGVGIVCNALLFAGKLLIGILSGSVSITADAMNNLTDAGSSVVTLIGFKLAGKPADEDHPYGHARFEYLSGLAVAAMILIIGFELGKTSVEKLLNPTAVTLSAPLIAVLTVSIVLKLALYLFNRRLGSFLSSSALFATATDSRNDAVSTAAVLVAAILEGLFGWKIDGFMGLLVALFILYGGWKLAKETISPLLGESASPELKKEIVALMKQEEAVLGYHDLMIHDYGPGQRFGSLHVEMDREQDPLYCHELIDNLERKSLQELGVHLVIHYDPIVIGDAETDEIRVFLTEALLSYDACLSLHDFRMVKGTGHTNLIFDITMPHRLSGQEKQIRKCIENALAEAYQDTFYLVLTFDKESVYEG